jgi:predicted 3-demethylubiquinone-9 3-methyltransferase (glyoxalase superfamily)
MTPSTANIAVCRRYSQYGLCEPIVNHWSAAHSFFTIQTASEIRMLSESACGWCTDKWGLSWQITPIALTKAITDPDPAVAKRAFDVMMTMKKIDIAVIEAARRG